MDLSLRDRLRVEVALAEAGLAIAGLDRSSPSPSNAAGLPLSVIARAMFFATTPASAWAKTPAFGSAFRACAGC
jgi:hypothetical protein